MRIQYLLLVALVMMMAVAAIATKPTVHLPDAARVKVNVSVAQMISGASWAEDRFIFFTLSHNGGNGKLFTMEGGPAKKVATFGEDSDLSEKGAYNLHPQYVGYVSASKAVLLNVICFSDFPSTEMGVVRDPAMRVVHVDLATGKPEVILVDVQKQNPGKHIEGVRWFDDKKLLLCSISDLSGSDVPGPQPGTARPLLVSLDGKQHDLSDHSTIQSWWRAVESVEVKVSTREIEHDGTRQEQMFRTIQVPDFAAIEVQWFSPLRLAGIHVINPQTFVVNDPKHGAYIFVSGRSSPVLLANQVVVVYDHQSQRALLQDIRAGQEDYTAIQLVDLLKAVTEGGPD